MLDLASAASLSPPCHELLQVLRICPKAVLVDRWRAGSTQEHAVWTHTSLASQARRSCVIKPASATDFHHFPSGPMHCSEQ